MQLSDIFGERKINVESLKSAEDRNNKSRLLGLNNADKYFWN